MGVGGPQVITPDMIPDEVVEAAAIILMGRLMVSQQDALRVWSGMYEPEKDQFRRESRAAIAAAINAWPGVEVVDKVVGDDVALLLPLPQEDGDE